MSFKSPYRTLFPAMRIRREFAMGAVPTYDKKVLGYNPDAYWPLWEASGGVAQCLVNSAQNGAYTGVTLGDTTTPWGDPAPFFDGVNDFVDIYSATFDGVFDGADGSLMIWNKVYNAGVWTDGQTHNILRFEVDGSNTIYPQYSNAANTMNVPYKAGVATVWVTHAPISSVDWLHWGFTWSASSDEVKLYLNGIQVGGTQNGLGVWSGGPLMNTRTVIGAATTDPVLQFYGWEAHCAVWAGTVLTQPQFADLAAW